MDTNRALKFQLDYLGTSLPNGFDLITNSTIVEKVPMADGILFHPYLQPESRMGG